MNYTLKDFYVPALDADEDDTLVFLFHLRHSNNNVRYIAAQLEVLNRFSYLYSIARLKSRTLQRRISHYNTQMEREKKNF